MRENRTSGSEGGGTEQSALPTPILLKEQTRHQHIEEHYQTSTASGTYLEGTAFSENGYQAVVSTV